jgi:hypothetical protein
LIPPWSSDLVIKLLAEGLLLLCHLLFPSPKEGEPAQRFPLPLPVELAIRSGV